jgi:hypothetical protein
VRRSAVVLLALLAIALPPSCRMRGTLARLGRVCKVRASVKLQRADNLVVWFSPSFAPA